VLRTDGLGALCQGQWILHFVKSEPNVWQAWDVWRGGVSMSCGRRSTRDTWVRRSGRWFPERGVHFGASDLQVC
jgi:hypothetical protein